VAERMIETNGVELCTEAFGHPADPPLLLIVSLLHLSCKYTPRRRGCWASVMSISPERSISHSQPFSSREV
jgi:hypothetical protein